RYIVALGIYQQAVKLDPTATEPSYKAGVCAVALGRMHLAADMFERVLQQDPGNATAKVNLQMARAAAAKRKPNAAYVGGAIASARRDLSAGRYALVERKLARVVRVAKPSARLYELRAEARLGLRKAREALSDAGRALALDPSSAVALRSLGDAQRQLGKRRKAIYYYQLYLARAAQASDRAAIERVIRELEMPGGS
ncbi:MAG: hypothetical protein KC503_02320, partial [Myxococcales bacterium]|nr:hypothetical protein [Myxococcales bacterium]